MEQLTLPMGESLMWRAHFTEGVINEFNYNNGFIRTPFDAIQKNDDLIKFELVGMQTEISFDKNGIFNIGENTYKINLTDELGNDLLDGPKNNLMMYRTATQQLLSKQEQIEEYHYGYKIENKKSFIKIKMHIDSKGYGFSVIVTGKTDFDLLISVFKNNEIVVVSENRVTILKDKTVTLSI